MQVVDLEPVLNKEGEEDAGCSSPAQTESVGRASPLLEIPEKYKKQQVRLKRSKQRGYLTREGTPLRTDCPVVQVNLVLKSTPGMCS